MGKETKKNKKKAEEKRTEATLDKLHLMMKLFTSNVLLENDQEDTEEYSEVDYNVCVYQILPYPTNTKDPKEFFIQQT
ncbi:MAG: hypothetical protein H6P94_543 [Thermoplasmatales archaeon]|nr:hypothetical protein [Thermoplasmatales archaeon]